MPTFVIANRAPKDYLGSPEAIAEWNAWFARLGANLVDPGNPVFERATLGNCGGKTVLTGFTLVKADGFEDAVALAKSCPALATGGGVEVGKLTELNPSQPQESHAVATARAHVDAWSNHDWDKARKGLAGDVHVVAMSTQPLMPATDTIGADAYMEGLVRFAQAVVPGSARVVASVGDERNALLMLTVKAAFGPGSAEVTLPAARLYSLDENNQIKGERVVFFVVAE